MIAAVYDVALTDVAAARAAIAEFFWFDPENPPQVVVAPLTLVHILRLE